MRKLPIFLAILILSFLLIGFLYAQLSSSFAIKNQGTIKAIGISVYKDSGCTQQLTSIDWGLIGVGETKTIPAWLRNEGTITVSVIMSGGNWVPSVSSSALSLSWDSQNTQVNAGSVKAVAFSLKALNNGTTNFAFDIVVVGSGT
jgi:hypothetical protein